ncbi:hypothetical protein PPERSA_04137 [Pseudocohnilembus persalinus]|uniref:Uncharacterized protein n=1 Tax=Pseudocohnilembus persalinus TaxID=266149 RepID=A0A0V0QNC1_PSEPJ|nr:hypothetical protein PPERSA_04137 [Pseudocohnilembus persalinus]|eukprot:KRX03585.1 hypothetical protein PPERSA_04137 [Pseudocohnilembus persalinus]
MKLIQDQKFSITLFFIIFCRILIPQKLSEYARLGSGSACRSVYGGLVQWNGPNLEIMKEFFEKREKDINYLPDSATLQQLSNTCVSQQILQESQQFYENVKMLIFCANFSSKEVPSTGGMKQSTDSSDFLKTRVLETVPKHMQKITNAIKNNDFDTFCDVTIKDSNSFHSVCLDSQPPIFYLNEFSKLIIALVEKLNSDLVQCKKEKKPYKIKNKIGYTYDAGPHAVLFIHKDSFDIIFAIFNQIFGLETCSLNKRAQNSLQDTLKIDVTEFQDLINFYKSRLTQQPSYLIQTEIGKGPSQI